MRFKLQLSDFSFSGVAAQEQTGVELRGLLNIHKYTQIYIPKNGVNTIQKMASNA